MPGLPPVDGEFDKVDLPGKKVVIPLSGYERVYSEQEHIELFKKLSWDYEVDILRAQIQSLYNDKVQIVLVFHSFGTFRAANYFRKYPDNHRITGIIDLGGAPVRFYPIIRKFVLLCRNLDD